MNFISAFDELGKLYESVDIDQLQEDIDEEVVEEAEEATTEEPVDDSETVEVNDYVLECSKCGALVIRAIKEVTEDGESGLANVGEECSFCEASDGFKILGTFAPYEEAVEEEAETEVIEDAEDDEVIEEGIFDRKKKSSKKAAGSANNDDVKREVNFKVYDQNGTLKFNRDFTELPGKMNADDQFKHAFKEMSVYNEYCNSTGKRDWSFERVSNPPSPAFDTKRGRTKFLSMDMHLEGLDSPEGDLEELFDISPNVSLSLSGGQGNDVDVL